MQPPGQIHQNGFFHMLSCVCVCVFVKSLHDIDYLEDCEAL